MMRIHCVTTGTFATGTSLEELKRNLKEAKAINKGIRIHFHNTRWRRKWRRKPWSLPVKKL